MAHGRLARVSSKGQIVLPKVYRDFLQITEGDYIYVKDVGPGLLVLSKIGEHKVDETVVAALNEAMDRIVTLRNKFLREVLAGKNR